MASYSSSDSSKQHSPSKASVLIELKQANRTINLKDEAIRKLEERLQRLEMKQPRSSHSINEEHHSHRPSSRGSSNDHGREEDTRRRRHHHHSNERNHHRDQRYHQDPKSHIPFMKIPTFNAVSYTHLTLPTNREV